MALALREHAAPLELRFSGRTLRAAVPYGERARDRAEQFAPGALRPTFPVTLNLQHDREFTIASTEDRSLRLKDTPEAMLLEADLRGGPLDMVRGGHLAGISPEFYARRERRDSGLRIIEAADLPAFGLVGRGSYRTPMELRAGHLLTALIPTGHKCSCECARDCSFVELATGSLDELIASADDVVAITGRMVPGDVLGSREAGSLLIERTEAGALVTLTNADTAAAASVRSAASVSPIHVRPVLDEAASTSTLVGDVRRFTRATFGVLLVKTAPPDRREGLTPAMVADPDPEARAAVDVRRRLWL